VNGGELELKNGKPTGILIDNALDLLKDVIPPLTTEMMNDCLQELNKEQKQCVTLFYLEKRSYNEIADHTGFSLLQVKSYIQNGKRNLKILLERKLNQS